MIDFKKDLNKEQYKVVVQGDGPCLVLAGAGSGKTRTITFRVAYLLEQGISPDNILLVTFTNKAAREMMSRVQELTGGKIKLPWSGTFHHVGYRILRRYAPLLGYKNNFTILDSEDSRDLLKICLKLEGVNRKQRRFPSAKVIQSIISYARNAEISIHDVLELKHPKWIDLSDTIARIAEEYSKRKKQANAMDFDDLLVNLYLLLIKSERVRKKYSEQFEYVLVDEYQDTNKIQASIIKLFASYHKNLLVVGDDAQSIYSFRAANIQNILDFERTYPNAHVYRLETNYRSTPDILDLANNIIAGNKNQYEKNLKSILGAFTKPEVQAFADSQEEAEFVAERILELRDEGVELNKIAVLFRAAFHSQALEMELAKRDIPYDYRGGIRFFERAHIKDVLAYLKIINNIEDAIAWSRVLNMQVGIGPATAQKIIQDVRSGTGLGMITNSLPARAIIGWNDFLSIWKELEKEKEKKPTDLIRAILKSKYVEYLEAEHPDYRERIQDIEQLALFAERASDLNRFLAEASLQESYASSQVGDITEFDDEKIVLSTIHQAKGLEWEAVFVINLAAGQFPNERSRIEDGLEEERRLFYVAVTRAKKYLHITYPIVGGITSYLQGPSLFLEELDNDLVSGSSLGESTAFLDPSDDVDDIVYEPMDEGGLRTSFLKGIDEL
ncbi:MAG: AAA family ATPase [Candidatus Magasanikbacteria bacterium]|nr:AAA family ATPase [Candidatus Magasanikbacteria bacterium]